MSVTSLHMLTALHYEEKDNPKPRGLADNSIPPRVYKHGFDFIVLIIFIFTLYGK